jgi:hypothetical protein
MALAPPGTSDGQDLEDEQLDAIIATVLRRRG